MSLKAIKWVWINEGVARVNWVPLQRPLQRACFVQDVYRSLLGQEVPDSSLQLHYEPADGPSTGGYPTLCICLCRADVFGVWSGSQASQASQ